MGRLEDVQAFIVMLINIMQLYYDDDKKGHDFIFKMLIPSNYVTKLIGQSRYIIIQRVIWSETLQKDLEELKSKYFLIGNQKEMQDNA